MKAKLIATVPSFVALENRHCRWYRFFLVEGTVYRVESRNTDDPMKVEPIEVVKCESKDIVLEGALKAHLEGHFLE